MKNTEQTENAPGMLLIYNDKSSLSHVRPIIIFLLFYNIVDGSMYLNDVKKIPFRTC